MRRSRSVVWGAMLVAWLSTAASAQEMVIRMGGPDGEIGIFPEITYVEVGETVRFRSTGHMHASRSINTMCPSDVSWRARIGEDVVVRFDEAGIYAFKCAAHYAMGMVGLVVVGGSTELDEEAREARHPPAAQEQLERLLAEAISRSPN